MRERTISTVDWKKYLDFNQNPRAKTFLQSRGDDVLWQIASNIDNSLTGSKPSNRIIMSVHPNAPAAILINREDYSDVLDLCIKWFEVREKYEVCKKVLDIKNKINLKKKANKKKVFQNII